jgi:peptide/nickel transport system substrate-binding protein
MVQNKMGKLVEKPQYGGILTYREYRAITPWDAAYSNERGMRTHSLVFEDLLMGDWTRGPIGTGEHGWNEAGPEVPEDFKYGTVAESWERPDATTSIYHIRKGARFHNKPPTNGREVTANDVVASFDYYLSYPKSHISASLVPPPDSITALDKYTVEIKWPTASAALEGSNVIEMSAKIFAEDALEEFGDMTDWRNLIGTGPYMVEDQIAGASVTLVRHPSYWENDPMHPDLDLQIPYIDKIKWVTIADKSTTMAALRTGKIDLSRDITWEDAFQMKGDRPDIQYWQYIFSAPKVIFLRQDIERPWNDKRVRHALWLAMDNPGIVNEFFGGYAEVLSAPILPSYPDWYVPLEEFPEETQERYTHNPAKARQLLKEAGYEDGFDVTVVVRTVDADLMTIVKANWAEVGVNLTIDAKEGGVHASLARSRGYEEGILYFGYSRNVREAINRYHPTMSSRNYARVTDPVIDENAAAVREAWLAGDAAEISRLIKEIQPHMLEQAWEIQPPNYYTFYLAQPWINRFTGVYSLGDSNYVADLRYLWLDLEMKKEMGY